MQHTEKLCPILKITITKVCITYIRMTTWQLSNCKGPENCETCRNQVKGHKRWRNLARQWREVQGQVKTLSELWLAGRCQVSTDLCAVKLYQPLSQMRTDWLGFGHVRYCNSTLMALLNFTTLRCVWDWKPASKSLRVSARWLSSAWTRLWHFIYIYIWIHWRVPAQVCWRNMWKKKRYVLTGSF